MHDWFVTEVFPILPLAIPSKHSLESNRHSSLSLLPRDAIHLVLWPMDSPETLQTTDVIPSLLLLRNHLLPFHRQLIHLLGIHRKDLCFVTRKYGTLLVDALPRRSGQRLIDFVPVDGVEDVQDLAVESCLMFLGLDDGDDGR